MSVLYLLGDSVIDNSVYVGPAEPDVPAQIRSRLPDVDVQMRAVDGYVLEAVAKDLDSALLQKQASVFLSVGGNNALGSLHLLEGGRPAPFAAAMSTLHQVRETFRGPYAALLDALGDRRVLVATIYNPNFSGSEAALQVPAEAALSAFNDVIQQEAHARGHALLDLRRLFCDAADYANPTEPSAQGGAKIASAVASWFREGLQRS